MRDEEHQGQPPEHAPRRGDDPSSTFRRPQAGEVWLDLEESAGARGQRPELACDAPRSPAPPAEAPDRPRSPPPDRARTTARRGRPAPASASAKTGSASTPPPMIDGDDGGRRRGGRDLCDHRLERSQRLGELAHRGEPPLRIGAHRPHHDLPELGWNARPPLARRHGVTGTNCREDLVETVSVEGTRTRQALIEDDAERPLITRRAGRPVIGNLLGGEIVRESRRPDAGRIAAPPSSSVAFAIPKSRTTGWIF